LHLNAPVRSIRTTKRSDISSHCPFLV
jgi:hypothetical protein